MYLVQLCAANVTAVSVKYFDISLNAELCEKGRVSCTTTLLFVVCPDADIVIIHDAVRPFVDEDCVAAVANAASEHGVSIT